MMKEITIGRHPNNDIVLTDPIVGKCCMKIVHEDDGRFLLHEIHSVNGNFVNGKPVKGIVELQRGDVVTIGNRAIVQWEPYFDKLELEELRKGLEGISHGKAPLPPKNNAMCYCPSPPESWWKRNRRKWLLVIIVSIIGFAIGILITRLLL